MTEEAAFAFRDDSVLRSQVQAAGFEITHVYGDRDRRPLDDTSRLIIIVAEAP
ncbi:hypothetical protein [Microbacterium hibisci]|uniref:hypothetical protein n=1 Tax=Microbacterium hibisci TaxID=2036000 RepID=UPI001944F3F9|nr:hypothetical protein [Microbacterium hibisci]